MSKDIVCEDNSSLPHLKTPTHEIEVGIKEIRWTW